MNRKVMAVAVAAAFAAPAALAQTTVTIGGTINIIYDNVRATNNTGGDTVGTANPSLKSHDRVRDGAGSNIRFFVGEDLGGGNQAFVQVESAVIVNSDTRSNALGSAAGVNGWGNRNSAIGVRSKSLGRFLIGVWDVHYDETYGADGGWLIVNSAASTLGLINNFGSDSINPNVGARYSNVIRWDSPVWSGFNLSLAYARPTDAAPTNTGGATGLDGVKNRAWWAALRYNAGGLHVGYSYLNDKDIPTTLAFSAGGANNVINAATAAAVAIGTFTGKTKVTSNRLTFKYRFAAGFGIGVLWASDKFDVNSPLTAGPNSMDIKRRVWALPFTYDTGSHSFFLTYAKANDWDGQFGGVSWDSARNSAAIGGQAANTLSFGSETGGKLVALGYAYKLSQRTNVGLSYVKITNDALARYDFFANASGHGSVGADPRMFAFNMRHTF